MKKTGKRTKGGIEQQQRNVPERDAEVSGALYIVTRAHTDYEHGVIAVACGYNAAKAVFDRIYENMHKSETEPIRPYTLSPLEQRFCQIPLLHSWRRTLYDWIDVVEMYKFTIESVPNKTLPGNTSVSNPSHVTPRDTSTLLDEAEMLAEMEARQNGLLFILYWEDSVKKSFHSMGVVGVYYSMEEASDAACRIENALRIRQADVDRGLDEGEEAMDAALAQSTTEVPPLEWKRDYAKRTHWTRSFHGYYGWIFVIQEIDNPIGNGDVELALGYHGGRHR